ncbi:MAG TPA: hypothetical protein VJ842_18080 [Pyrinomonadaceae bacterium]|nr:hypothetical protein [Pyrinomonadaceae bacterium]
MMKRRTGMIAAALVAALSFALPLASAQNTQTSPVVELSDIKIRSGFGYISGTRFNADRSGRPEDDYPGYPVSRMLPPEAGKGASFLPRQNYYVTARVKNTGAKTVKYVNWEITYFADANKTQKLGCHSSRIVGKVKPGQTKSLRGIVSANHLKTTPYSTTNILRVEYSDRTVWETEGFSRDRFDRPCGS